MKKSCIIHLKISNCCCFIYITVCKEITTATSSGTKKKWWWWRVTIERRNQRNSQTTTLQNRWIKPTTLIEASILSSNSNIKINSQIFINPKTRLFRILVKLLTSKFDESISFKFYRSKKSGILVSLIKGCQSYMTEIIVFVPSNRLDSSIIDYDVVVGVSCCDIHFEIVI